VFVSNREQIGVLHAEGKTVRQIAESLRL